jgi:hypothetical protein
MEQICTDCPTLQRTEFLTIRTAVMLVLPHVYRQISYNPQQFGDKLPTFGRRSSISLQLTSYCDKVTKILGKVFHPLKMIIMNLVKGGQNVVKLYELRMTYE